MGSVVKQEKVSWKWFGLFCFFATWFHFRVSSLPLLLISVLAPQILASLSYHSVLPEFLGHHEDQSNKRDGSRVGILSLNKSQQIMMLSFF